MQLVSEKVGFNACQVSLLWHNSFLVTLWTSQATLVQDVAKNVNQSEYSSFYVTFLFFSCLHYTWLWLGIGLGGTLLTLCAMLSPAPPVAAGPSLLWYSTLAAAAAAASPGITLEVSVIMETPEERKGIIIKTEHGTSGIVSRHE